MNNQLFHDYKIQHAPNKSSAFKSRQQSLLLQETIQKELIEQQQSGKLKENLMILNQFFIQNPIGSNIDIKPNAVKGNQDEIRQIVNKPCENQVDNKDINQRMVFLNLSTFNKPIIPLQQQRKQKSYFPNSNQFQQEVINMLENKAKPRMNSQKILQIQKTIPQINDKVNVSQQINKLKPIVNLSTKRNSDNIIGSQRQLISKERFEPVGWLDMNVIQRNEKWNNLKKEKTLILQKQKFDDEILDCTFKPATTSVCNGNRSMRSGTPNSVNQKISAKQSNFYSSPNDNQSRLFNETDIYLKNFKDSQITQNNQPLTKNSQLLSKAQSKSQPYIQCPVSYGDIFKSRQYSQKNKLPSGQDQSINYGLFDLNKMKGNIR